MTYWRSLDQSLTPSDQWAHQAAKQRPTLAKTLATNKNPHLQGFLG